MMKPTIAILIWNPAHVTTPNLGQGACMAIEDAVILASEMRKNNNMKMHSKTPKKGG